jgi:hypothetical protein
MTYHLRGKTGILNNNNFFKNKFPSQKENKGFNDHFKKFNYKSTEIKQKSSARVCER